MKPHCAGTGPIDRNQRAILTRPLCDEHGMGFTVTLTGHHCHGTWRFRQTLICGDCNSADGAAKRKLGLPESWSFPPADIGSFVTVAPHSGATRIDYDCARQIYDAAR